MRSTVGPTDPDLDAVMRASRVIAGIVAESIARAGDAVTVPQLRVLVLLASGADINASAVAAALDVHPSNATRILDRLAQAGLLERREAALDRRNVELSLTDDGRRLVESVMEHRREAFERVLSRMSATARRRLGTALQAFADAAGEPVELALSY
jgi:DNA-binding MarR family transcriptional regulator